MPISGRYRFCTASRHWSESCSSVRPSTPAERRLDATRERGLEDRTDRLVAPALADVGQQRLAEAVREELVGSVVICSMVGSFPSSDASRSHIAVFGSIGPSDMYSAMPSTNQSGGVIAMMRLESAAGAAA